MNLSISQPSLREALASVARAVSPRSTLPVLANVLLRAENNQLQVSATDLKIGISRWLEAIIKQDGEITIPARTLIDLVNALPNDTIHLELNQATMTLTVKCGKNRTSIKGIDAKEFPPIPSRGGGTALVAEEFCRAISQTAFSASTEEARPVLQGVHWSEGELQSTDGFRLSIVKSVGPEKTALVPATSLVEVAKLAKGGTLSLRLTSNQAVFEGDGWLLVSQLVDGQFPDAKVIIPRRFSTRAVVNTAALLKACKQAEIIARNGNGVVRLDLAPGGDAPGTITVAGQSEETGDAEIVVDANIEGGPMSIAFNVRFLADALAVVETPDVVIEANDGSKPAVISQPGNDAFRHVIMPMLVS